MKLLITIEVDAQKTFSGLKNLHENEYQIVEVKVQHDQWVLILTACGGNKIMTVKTIREVTGLELRESKDIADNLTMITSLPSKEEAIRVQKLFEAVGASTRIELKKD